MKLLKLKILITEDIDMILDYYSLLLNKFIAPASGYQTQLLFASNGKEAVDICKNNEDIQLVLMDVQMPVMDGYTATKEIRKFNSEVIIVAQTAYAMDGEIDRALNAGCNDYLTKPINKKGLSDLLHKYFGKN